MTAKKNPTRKTGKKAAAKKPTERITLKTGDTIERVLRGKTIKLTVTEDGYRIGKTTYRSLTAAAKATTGYAAISGPRFWGTDGGAK